MGIYNSESTSLAVSKEFLCKLWKGDGDAQASVGLASRGKIERMKASPLME
jgi:hypothetical protein